MRAASLIAVVGLAAAAVAQPQNTSGLDLIVVQSGFVVDGSVNPQLNGNLGNNYYCLTISIGYEGVFFSGIPGVNGQFIPNNVDYYRVEVTSPSSYFMFEYAPQQSKLIFPALGSGLYLSALPTTPLDKIPPTNPNNGNENPKETAWCDPNARIDLRKLEARRV